MPLGQNLCAANVAAATVPRKTSEVLIAESALVSGTGLSGRETDEERECDRECDREWECELLEWE